jgi:hypothetical protein
MPKRVIDGDALWRSTKLGQVQPPSIRAEVANLIPLASDNGSFRCDPDGIWADVYAFNRPDVTREFVKDILDELERVGILLRFLHQGKVYGYWNGIDAPGRLPSRRWRTAIPNDVLRATIEEHMRSSCATHEVDMRSSCATHEVDMRSSCATHEVDMDSSVVDQGSGIREQGSGNMDLDQGSGTDETRIDPTTPSSNFSPGVEKVQVDPDQTGYDPYPIICEQEKPKLTLSGVTPQTKTPGKSIPVKTRVKPAQPTIDPTLDKLVNQFAGYEGLTDTDDLSLHYNRLADLLKDKGDPHLIEKVIDFAWTGDWNGDGKTLGDPFMRQQADNPVALFVKKYREVLKKYRRSTRGTARSATSPPKSSGRWETDMDLCQ